MSVTEKPQNSVAPPSARLDTDASSTRVQFRRLALCGLVLVLGFAKPLLDLVRFAAHSELYSYILLVPFVSVYLAWLKKEKLCHPSEPLRLLALPLFFAGLGLLAIPWCASGLDLAKPDSLAWFALSFFLLFLCACAFCLGSQILRALAFPLGFLIFIVPFPAFLEQQIESFLRYASADASELLFFLVGTPLLRDGTVFRLPGIEPFVVARECSGIHSSLVLFITSLVAGQLFLRSPWKRLLLTLIVIPLGILRNGLRILTIGELCVHVSPNMIYSPIHTRGGPIFFALSLLPFLLLLYFLRRSDLRNSTRQNHQS